MNVLIRTDASVEIGSGHLMRCLTLADQLCKHGTQVAFVCRDFPGAMFGILENKGYPYVKLPMKTSPTPERDAEETLHATETLFSQGVDWLVVDHYGLDAQWERMLRRVATKIMVIDDLADRLHDCDLLLDQNYYHDMEQRYQGLVPDSARCLLGPSYVLLRQEFIDMRKYLRARDGKVHRVMVFFGGSDPTNQTQKVIEAFRLLDRPDVQVDIVVGMSNPHRHTIEARCTSMPNLKFSCQVTNMAELISAADLAIGAGGAAMWERCYLGLPTITVVFAANQVRTTADVAVTGAIEYLGWADQLDTDDYVHAIAAMLESPQRVRSMGGVAMQLIESARPAVADAMVCWAGKG